MGAVTRSVIVVELVTLLGLAVPLTRIEYRPGVVDELVVIVSVDVAVAPELNVTGVGSKATVG